LSLRSFDCGDEDRLFARETRFRLQNSGGAPAIQEIYAAIASDADRNELILNDVISALEDGRSPILLTGSSWLTRAS
jgi:hypothetical protein